MYQGENHRKETQKKFNKTQIKKQSQLSKALLSDFGGEKKWKNLFAPVDISTIVLFRILFGLIMLWEVYRYFTKGWIDRYWIDPAYHFYYWPINFIAPLSGNGMHLLFGFMAFLCMCIIAGFLYRISIILFFICFTYTFLLEQGHYLNHFYLIVLLSFTMVFIPASKSGSIDARIFKNYRDDTVPGWKLWLLRFMIALPYFFGGIAKIGADWLQGEPLKTWLANDTDFPLIGPLFTQHWFILFFAYSGLLLDLLVVPALLFKRTRGIAIITITLFHLLNAKLFEIGIFPWFMIGATTLFLDPGWFRNVINNFKRKQAAWKIETSGTGSIPEYFGVKQKLILASLAIWVALHCTIPLRHLLFPGQVDWTEEGHLFSWHMKLRSKRSDAQFIVKDKKTGEQEVVDTKIYLAKWQEKKMNVRPELIWQFCQIIKKEYAKQGRDVAVYADVKSSLNGRQYQQFTDPAVDLASTSWSNFSTAKWILPLTVPLKKKSTNNEDQEADIP